MEEDKANCRGASTTRKCSTLFPGSLFFPPPGAREERPWLGLVTCLPEPGKLQINVSREGRLSVKFVATEPRGERKVFLCLVWALTTP